MASTYLTNTNPTSGNRTKGTISVWFKRANISSSQYLYSERYDNNNRGYIELKSNDQLNFQSLDGGSTQAQIQTNRVFRDTNAWYHLVAAWDSTQSTASDRIKIYINGVQETSFAVNTQPSQNTNLYFGVGSSSYPIVIGRRGDNANYFDGSMSHFHRVDNQQLAQTVFGSTDSTTGEWKINTSPSITYTGSSSFNFFVLKNDNSVTDQSGQSNNLTVGGGTLTKTEDCPSNIFATFNDNANNANAILSQGSTTVSHSSTSWKRALSNLGATSGKWYWEIKRNNSNTPFYKFGMIEEDGQHANMPAHEHHADNAYGWAWYVNGGNIELRTNQAVISGYSQSELGNTNIANGDIVCIALDLDNGRLHARKNNGSWLKSGDPTAGTGGYAISNWSAGKLYIPASSVYQNATCEHNFGNGYFGTTAVSSAGTNASGIGIFEYDVPTGYTALTTKGLNE